jgi:dipeptidase E
MPSNTLAHAERWAREIGHESYAMDDQSAITVIHGESRVISEGAWRHFES